MCWCDETHTRGSMHNGEVKHYVANWKLYQIRHKEPKKVKKPAPALEPVAVGLKRARTGQIWQRKPLKIKVYLLVLGKGGDFCVE